MYILLLAVTCPHFGSNGMHSASIVFITIVITVCLHILQLFGVRKKSMISIRKLKQSLKILTASFVRNFFH